MLDIEDPKTKNNDRQQLASDNNSALDNQTNSNPQEVVDDTIYVNMIFPS